MHGTDSSRAFQEMRRNLINIPEYYTDGIGNVFLNKVREDRLAANRVILCAMSKFAIENNRDFVMIGLDNGILAMPEYDFMIIQSGFAGIVKL